MADLSFERDGCAVAKKYHDEICSLYDATFSVDPFVWSEQDSTGHREMLVDIRRDPTFGIAIAKSGGKVIAFAYGHRLPVDHGWWDGFSSVLPPSITTEWEGRTFALIDFAVDKLWRGKGIGRRVLNFLLEERQEERAVLSVQPTAVETEQIYIHLGWRKVGQKGPIAGVTPPHWDIFFRTL